MTLHGRGLVCDYGPTRALDGVSVSASAASLLAVFGPNGAGKTTLLKVLSGERRPDSGSVLLDGKPVSGADPTWRARIGLVSHRTGLYETLTVAENLRFFAGLHGRQGGRAGRRKADADLAAALDRVGAGALADARVGALSRGQRQRVALARTLLHDPEVVFLDEPFTGLDPDGASLLEAALAELASADRIVVLAMHDVARGLRLADRFLVLRGGRKALEGKAAEHDAGEVAASFGAGGIGGGQGIGGAAGLGGAAGIGSVRRAEALESAGAA